MQDKILDSTLENLLSRINDLKSSIAAMILKIEHESDTLNWPTLLDNFALLSGQVINSLHQVFMEYLFRCIFFDIYDLYLKYSIISGCYFVDS